jgi:hypothetical protein
MIQLYLVLYDLEYMQASKKSMLSPHGYTQWEEPQARTLARFSRLWSLDDVLQFWERFEGQLNQGFLPPKDSDGGQWSYDTIPPHWFRYENDNSGLQHENDNSGLQPIAFACAKSCSSIIERAEPSPPIIEHAEPSPPRVPIMVPAPWKEWVENLVALLQVAAQHSVQINISWFGVQFDWTPLWV